MICSKCNSALKPFTNCCNTCGNPVSDVVLDIAWKIHSRNLVFTGIVRLIVVCVAWAALAEFIPSGWMMAVVNIGLLILSLLTLLPIHTGLKFILGDSKSWLPWVITCVIGFLMISILRTIVGELISYLFK